MHELLPSNVLATFVLFCLGLKRQAGRLLHGYCKNEAYIAKQSARALPPWQKTPRQTLSSLRTVG